MDKETISVEIQEICDELLLAADEIAKLEPVTYLSKSKIQWSGGIIGAIQESRESKRLVNILNGPLYNGKSYTQYSLYIIDSAKKLIDKQIEFQSIASREDPDFFGNVYKIKQTLEILLHAWFNYSPDVAIVVLNIEEGVEDSLNHYVRSHVRENFKRLQLPQELIEKEDSNKDNSNENSGCLGVLLALIIIPTTLVLIFS